MSDVQVFLPRRVSIPNINLGIQRRMMREYMLKKVSKDVAEKIYEEIHSVEPEHNEADPGE